MAVVEFVLAFIAGAGCAGALLFVLALTFVDVTEHGWSLKTPW
ncbi:hypothetical protein [Arabiibacter massiliensis]|nr:hypothetical protein [Arabiibacter massiliensis]